MEESEQKRKRIVWASLLIIFMGSLFAYLFFTLYPLPFTLPAPEGMVLVPAGEFTMGTDEVDSAEQALEYGIVKPWFEDEHPSRRLFLPGYFVDQYEVTNSRYLAFLQISGRRPPERWPDGRYPAGRDADPVNRITWEDAYAYCAWNGKTLPTEAEWEKAARGSADARRYPWGHEFNEQIANIGGLHGGIQPVGSFEAGNSPYGVYDMIGNVWEWTNDWYAPYPGSSLTDEFYDNKFGNRYKTIRGLSWSMIGHYDHDDTMIIMAHYARISYRLFFDPRHTLDDVGFRCVKSAD
jgi:formylglycine-generating enzyme required for sulfatase activity